MAVCLVMQFARVDAAKYDSVMEELGLRSANANWPKGIISHVAGFDSNGMYVVEVWESQRDFDTYADSRLKPAFEAAGGLPMPGVTTFDVHNSYNADTAAQRLTPDVRLL
jgi:hypothetical protein